MKKISVIVPIFNSEKYLNRCIESILCQTYKNIEVILVDDGSTDNSGRICDLYKNKNSNIQVIRKCNGGQSSARNKGIEIATGDYIAFVDSDDWIANDIYEYCINLSEATNSDVVDFKCIFTKGENTNPQQNCDFNIKIVEDKEILRDYLLRGQTEKAPFSPCRKLYKSNLFTKIRFPEGKINEDISTNYKVLMNCKRIVHTDKIGYFYFQNSISTTRNGLMNKDFDLLDACKELEELTLNEDYTDIQYLVKVKYARSYFSLLAKIAFYGISDETIDRKSTIDYLTCELRKNFRLLIKSPMQLNRKLMVIALCININLLSVPLSVYKYLIRK